jgi:hypothetical protein
MKAASRRKAPKPFSEMTPDEQRAEARAAIARLEETRNTGDNRYGAYGRNVRDAIARRERTLADLGPAVPVPSVSMKPCCTACLTTR